MYSNGSVSALSALRARLLQASVCASIFLLFVISAPTPAAAQTSNVQTRQLLPPGQNTCQPLSVSDIQPHVYDGGMLESFDLTISDNSYVGLFGTTGNTSIPLQYITRWAAAAPGSVRIHVDTPTTPVYAGLPVSLTLLSAAQGQPVCVSVISFNVGVSGSASVTTTPGAQPIPQPITSGSGSPVGTNSGHPAGNTTTTQGSGTPVIPSGSTTTTSSSTGNTAQSLNVVGAIAGIPNICINGNAYRLWFILLAVYLIIVAVVIFAEPWFLERSVLGATAAILVPLILLLAFWYFSATCRAASWIPVVACVIAVVGLFLAFREYETTPVPNQ